MTVWMFVNKRAASGSLLTAPSTLEIGQEITLHIQSSGLPALQKQNPAWQLKARTKLQQCYGSITSDFLGQFIPPQHSTVTQQWYSRTFNFNSHTLFDSIVLKQIHIKNSCVAAPLNITLQKHLETSLPKSLFAHPFIYSFYRRSQGIQII